MSCSHGVARGVGSSGDWYAYRTIEGALQCLKLAQPMAPLPLVHALSAHPFMISLGIPRKENCQNRPWSARVRLGVWVDF